MVIFPFMCFFRLLGSYESLQSVEAHSLIAFMLGGIGQVLRMFHVKTSHEKQQHLFEQMLEDFEAHSSITTSKSVSRKI